MKTVQVAITGTLPLLQNSQRRMNLRDPLARDLATLSKKRGKTDEDRLKISDLEFRLAVYWNPKLCRVYVPAWNIIRSIQDGGKKLKLGTKVIQGLRAHPSLQEVPLIYPGVEKVRSVDDLVARDDLWDVRTVKVSGTVERTRIIFPEWRLVPQFLLDGEILGVPELQSCVESGGLYYGLGDYRVGTDKGGQYGTYEGAVTPIEGN